MGRDRQDGSTPRSPTTADLRAFWERFPVAAASIAAPPGTPEFFAAFERLRQAVEPRRVQDEIYTFPRWAGKAVLDVGCGNGYLLSRFVQAGAWTVGVDLTWMALGLSRQRFALQGAVGRLVQADADGLPFLDGSFDCVVSTGVLHHIPSIERAIAEIHRLLRSGGTFLLMLYHRNSLHFRVLYPLYGWIHPDFRGFSPAEVARRIDGADNPIGRTYTRREVRRLLAMFREVRLSVRSLPIRPVQAIPGGAAALDLLARRLGWFLYAQAVK